MQAWNPEVPVAGRHCAAFSIIRLVLPCVYFFFQLFGKMMMIREAKSFATIIPKSVIDNLPIKKEETEKSVAETSVNEKVKRRRGRPAKIKTSQNAESIANASDTSRVDGQWVRKNESDVGDGVKVKAECEPQIQGYDTADEAYSENVVIIKNEPIDDSFDNVTNCDSTTATRFSSDASDRSTYNIKEEPLDIYHENMSQDLNNSKAKEFYVEEVNYDVIKIEINEENDLEQQFDENFIKCESAITSDNEDKYSKDKSNEIRHTCKYCGKTYKNKCHLNRHIKYECLVKNGMTSPRYKCANCHMHFKTKYTMERHIATIHLKKGERTSCDACCKTFRDKQDLKRHLTQFSCNGLPTNTFTCKNCNKKYRHANSIWRHMKYECEKVPRFGCAHCDYMTSQKGNIVKHFRRKHMNEDEQTKYDCPTCKKTYKNEFTLKRHVNFECGKEPAFSCALCKFRTKRKFSLDMHIRNRHCGVKN